MRHIGPIRLIRPIKKENIFSFLVYLSLFLFLLYPYRDYDWGWHFRNGEHLIKTGQMVVADPYSWTMEGYRWVNHSWLYDPILYLLYTTGGFFTLTLAGAVVAMLIFFLGTLPYKLKYWQTGILAYFYAMLTSGVFWQGLRSQMIGGLLLALTLRLLIKAQNYLDFAGDQNPKSKTSYFLILLALPVLFLAFANLHGTFALGLLFFAFFVFSQYIPKKIRFVSTIKINNLKLLFLGSFIASILVTFINPFGYRIYLETLRHYGNPLLPYILEWDPVAPDTNFFAIYAVSIILLGFEFLKVRKRKNLPYILATLAALYLAFGARRYMATYAIVALPFAAILFKDLKINLERFKTTGFVFFIIILVSIEITLFRRLPDYHLYKLFSYDFNDYCFFGSDCSEELTSYLLKNPPQGRGLNYYDWGGYLIGRGVKAKLFIDGRMHLWKQETDGFQPFPDYQNMYYEQDWALFNKYNFDWVIAEPNSKIINKMKESTDLGLWESKFLDDKSVYIVRKR